MGTSLFEAAFQLSGMTRAQVRQPRKHGVPLRVRRIGDCYVQTIKATSNGRLLRARRMGKRDRERGAGSRSRPAATALEPLLSDKLRRRLEPLFELACGARVIRW